MLRITIQERRITDKLPNTIPHVFHPLHSNKRMTLTRMRLTSFLIKSVAVEVLLHSSNLPIMMLLIMGLLSNSPNISPPVTELILFCQHFSTFPLRYSVLGHFYSFLLSCERNPVMPAVTELILFPYSIIVA
jgi:hypothetical protein